MKNWLQIGVFLIGLGLAQGQSFNLLKSYLGESNGQQQTLVKDQIAKLVTKLNAKPRKSDRQFLMGVFNLTHRQFLKEYRQYSSFNNIFERGQYDCVTATALYSLLLTELGYEHQIVETKYHIFILVKSEDGEFLMESTDPISGFEYQQERIKTRISQYLTDDNDLVEGQLNRSEKVAAYQNVTPSQLTGLLYYNQCVKYFNDNQLQLANHLLLKAKLFYDSPRMDELENILQNQMAISEVKISSSDLGGQVTQRQEP